ncbi:MAG: T9SS C-terminal target domain-containing protein [Calditrichaeota bacterium]|nr:family 10 glycosylhydrolase [Calditrichota bacterium]RQW07274.1 MAG: T9SS C-terminal target domain-containing protein [Calditrichota bacterium]
MLQKFFIFSFSLMLLSQANLRSQDPELRGVWIAWAGSNIPSKEQIAAWMEDVAAHNLNTVYVDVWRFSYPYFKSQVFYNETGLWTDPALPQGRDVLEDMIAEGHRVGLHVEAWFEYGFVACQGSSDHLYQVHPDWFSRSRSGSVLFNGAYEYKWLAHTNPDAQQFLIDLCQEVVTRYDVDGIEFDRVRYPELDCGYDSVTIQLYKNDHNGNPPPQNISDPEWRRWRAEKLTEFMARAYDSLKAVRPDLEISNAPIVYPYGYDNFCQDWRPWINEGHLDFVTPQVYRSSNASFTYELDLQLNYVNDPSRFYPGLTSITNSYLVPTGEIIGMIETIRNRGLPGHVIWYYNTVADDLPELRDSVYLTPVSIPNRLVDWRQPAIIVNEDDPGIQRSSGWTVYSTLPGFENGCLYSLGGGGEWIEYSADIPRSGWYELYAYLIYQFNATQQAAYQVLHSAGIDTVYVDQSLEGNARWHKIGDYYLEQGDSATFLRLDNENTGSKILFTDAVMLLNSNRASMITGIPEKSAITNPVEGWQLLQNYPNPFNSSTTIRFRIPHSNEVCILIYDILGRLVRNVFQGKISAGEHSVTVNSTNLTSGIYHYVLKSDQESIARKMMILK